MLCLHRACERVFTRRKPNKVAWPWADGRPSGSPPMQRRFVYFPARGVRGSPAPGRRRIQYLLSRPRSCAGSGPSAPPNVSPAPGPAVPRNPSPGETAPRGASSRTSTYTVVGHRAARRAPGRGGAGGPMPITRPDWPANGLFFAFSRPLAEGWPGSAGRWPKILSTLHCTVALRASLRSSRYTRGEEEVDVMAN